MPTPILYDNNSTINPSNDQLFHTHIKHIDVHWHYLHERIEECNLVLSWVHGTDNTTDIQYLPSLSLHRSCLLMHLSWSLPLRLRRSSFLIFILVCPIVNVHYFLYLSCVFVEEECWNDSDTHDSYIL